jgi:hypothetical protein
VERLSVVTMTVCTPKDFPGALGDDYASACAALTLPATKGYALIQAQDVAGARWTVISKDVSGVQSALSIEAMGVAYGYLIEARTVVTVRPGWVLNSRLGLIDRPAPHPPLGTSTSPARSEGRSAWAPSGRRELADQIARELEEPPGLSRAEYFQTMYGDSDPEPDEPRLVDLLRVSTDLTQPVIQDALTGAWSLAGQERSPGTIRVATAGTGVRMVRATGPSWSLLARPRTSGPAVLLLDDAPGAVIDLAGAEGLDDLLDALTGAADRS